MLCLSGARSSLQAAWGVLLAACLGLLAACTAESPQQRGPAAGSDRVLVISPRGFPEVYDLVALLAAGGRGSPPLPPVAADVINAESAAEVYAGMRKLQPQLQRYRAIYTNSITYARAIQLVTPEVPIVFEGVDDPLARCLVDSLQRPGRNATGYMHQIGDSELKMVELLQEGFPQLRDVVMLVSHENVPPPNCEPDDDYWLKLPQEPCKAGERALDAYIERRVDGARLKAFAEQKGLRLHFEVVCSAADVPRLAHAADRLPAAGWLVPWHDLFDLDREPLVRALNASGRPAIYPHHGYTRVGGLVSLGIDLDVGTDRASVLALLQVLGGAATATLPVQMPRGMSLVVNPGAATRPDLHPSLALLRRADKVLQ